MTEVIAIVLGVVLGMISGMLPGIGPSFVILMLMPLLANFDLISLFLFYMVMVSTSQYYGSVSAIIYGVTGELSSLPAVVHGHPLYRSGRGSELLALTATSSFMASIFGILLIVITQFFSDSLIWFFKQHVILTVYSLVMILLVVLTKNKILSMVMLLLGLLMGKMGYDTLFATSIILPRHSSWEAGIPFYALFAGFIMFPILIDCMRQNWRSTDKKDAGINIKPRERLRLLVNFPHLGSVARGTLIGSVIGLVPGASYFFSSNIAEKIEKHYTDDPARKVVSAEAANNSGSITVLLPLMFFAIPIIPSESIILSIAETMGFGYTVSLDFMKNHLLDIVAILVVANLFNWLISGYFYKTIGDFYWKIKTWVYPTMLIFCTGVLLYVAWTDNNLMVSAVVFLIALLFGTIIKNIESKFVMMFGFFMADFVIDEFYRFFIINFI
jgi:putative tricarboxylic transport membrane protein